MATGFIRTLQHRRSSGKFAACCCSTFWRSSAPVVARCTLSSGCDLLTNGPQMWGVFQEKEKNKTSKCLQCEIIAGATWPTAWKHSPSTQMYRLCANEVLLSGTMWRDGRQTDGGDVDFWLPQWTAKVWFCSQWTKQEVVLKVFRPPSGVDAEFMCEQNGKSTSCSCSTRSDGTSTSKYTVCVTHQYMLRCVWLLHCSGSAKQPRSAVCVVMSASCDHDSLCCDLWFHDINVWRWLLLPLSPVLFPASRRASVTQVNTTAAYKNFTSLGRTTPRFLKNCFVRDAFCLPADTWQVLPCCRGFHRSFSNYNLPTSAALWPAVSRLPCPPPQTTNKNMGRNLVRNF